MVKMGRRFEMLVFFFHFLLWKFKAVKNDVMTTIISTLNDTNKFLMKLLIQLIFIFFDAKEISMELATWFLSRYHRTAIKIA